MANGLSREEKRELRGKSTVLYKDDPILANWN